MKFTGTPAWPTQQRDDEVWVMAAFLRTFPQLNAEEYRQLVLGEHGTRQTATALSGLLGPQPAPPVISASCARCHREDGCGRGARAFPKLAGQRPTYLRATMEAYAHGHRHSGIMQPLATGFSNADLDTTAQYYSMVGKTSSVYLSQSEIINGADTIAYTVPEGFNHVQSAAQS